MVQKNGGADIKGRTITVDSDRLYSLVDLHGQAGEHTLRLELSQASKSSAFTFW